METVPEDPTTAPRRGVDTDDTQAEVEWDEITGDSTGGSDITSYELVMNDGAGGTVFTAIVGNPTDFTSLSHTETGLTSGATYKFKYRAKNVHGWSTGYSPEVSILIATVPDKPTAVQTVNNGLSVDISWTAPAFTGGDSVALTAYTIQILQSDGLTYST